MAAKDDDGKLENWNKFLKRVCVTVGQDFNRGKKKGFYHQQLQNFEILEIYLISVAENHPIKDTWLTDPSTRESLKEQLPKGVVAKANAKAQKEVIKLFLSHLCHYWRQMRNLPIKKPRSKHGEELIFYPGMPALEFVEVEYGQ